MSSTCMEVSDAIWNLAREGIELTEEELHHTRLCSSCAAALAEARACVAALGCVRPYPAAPDCRSAVMDRILVRRARPVRAWAYVCALLLVAVMIGGALLRPHGGRPASEQAKSLPGIPSYAPQSAPLPVPEPKLEMHVDGPEKPRVPQRERPRRLDFRRFQSTPYAHKVQPTNTAAPATPKPAEENPRPRVTPTMDDSSALAYVTWPIANEQMDSYRYSYTVTDPATGETTKCSVKREGNAIEINMESRPESKPAKPEMKPAKESNSNEAIRCG